MPEPTKHLAQLYVEWTDGDIEGSYVDLAQKYMDNLLLVEVDDSLYMPDMFTIQIMDPGIEALKADVFKPGRKIKISVQQESSTERVELMRGEITSIEPDLNSTNRTLLTARGYDLSHRMNRVRTTATFLNVTDSDLATRLAQGAGLIPVVTATPIVHDYVMQSNQTDWEFLLDRAQLVGYRLFVEGKKLYFEPPPTSPAVNTQFKWGIDLDDFRARLSTIEQVTQVTVRSFDHKAKQTIIGQATSPTGNMQNRKDNGSTGGQAAQTAHSIQGKEIIVDRPVFTQTEADKIAQAVLDQRAAKFIHAEASTGGNPRVRAATSVDILDIGPRFSSKYLVTRSIHRYTSKGYTMNVWMSGGSDSIIDLLQAGHTNGSSYGGGKGSDRPTARGLMVGLVSNNEDTENRGRVKVKFPALGDSTESFWCHLATPMAGNSRGIAYFPEVNDQVVVAFEHGDPNHGYVLGAVWNGMDIPPKPNTLLGEKLVEGGKTIRRVSKSRLGQEITLDDKPGPSEGILIIDKTGKNLFRIITQDKKIKIEADGDIEITSNLGDINIKASTGKVNVNGLNGVNSKSDSGKVTNTGNMGVDIKADAGKVTASGNMGVDVTSVAIVNVKGTLINLN